MDRNNNGFCRLCAKVNPFNNLISLQHNEDKKCDIIIKLARINASTKLAEDILPKTVCFVCNSALDSAFDFVIAVEKAQEEFKHIALIEGIKKEISNSDSENVTSAHDGFHENFDVKLEEEHDKEIKPAVLNNDGLTPLMPIKNSSKDNLRKCLNSIPLSQFKLTWKDYSWMCTHCETQFVNVDELRIHSMQYHNCCNPFRCIDCNCRKLKLKSFLLHVRRHRQTLKLSCYMCATKFTSISQAKVHEYEHIRLNHVCSGCNSSFCTFDELKEHVNNFYKDRNIRGIPKSHLNNSLTCLICKKKFKTKTGLGTHHLIHTERKRNHVCEICGKCFLHKQTLFDHKKLHDHAKPFQCQICKSSFTKQHNLREHVGTHDGQKPYSCDQCGKQFRLEKQLKSHNIVHTDSLPHVCSYCNKAFRFKSRLNQHLRQHTGIKPYSCDMCQKDFTNWPNYNKHMKRKHSKNMAKKIHTPEGVCPVNPMTGEIIVYTPTNESLEWKKKIMTSQRCGRPKKLEV